MKTNMILALPATQPKPRKEDVLNALVERAHEKWKKEFAALQEKRTKALEACKEEAKKILVEQIGTLTPSYEMPWIGSSKKFVEISFHVSSAKLERLIAAYNNVPCLKGFDPVAVKKSLREKLAPSSARVDALLANPDAVKALDHMLVSLA